MLAHNDIGHHGFYAMNALRTERYWWPFMVQDINWFILMCYLRQLRKTQQIIIPPTVAMPAPLFSKVYMDTMHMLMSAGYKYIVQGCCSLTHWPEWEITAFQTDIFLVCVGVGLYVKVPMQTICRCIYIFIVCIGTFSHIHSSV